MGRVRDSKRSDRPRVVRTAQVINAVTSIIYQILSEKKHGSGNEHCAENALSNKTWDFFKRQTGQRLTIALKENWGGGRLRRLLYTKQSYKEILFRDEKNFTVEETFNKQNDGVYARPSKEARKLVPRVE